jgi:hypothetical protein
MIPEERQRLWAAINPARPPEIDLSLLARVDPDLVSELRHREFLVNHGSQGASNAYSVLVSHRPGGVPTGSSFEVALGGSPEPC